MKSSLIEFMSYLSITNNIVIAIGIFSALYVLYAKPIKAKHPNTILGALIVALISIWRLGCQPIGWGTWGDRHIYAHLVIWSKNSSLLELLDTKDPIFTWISHIIYNMSDIDWYFIILATIYTSLYFYSSQRMVDKKIFWMFVTFLLSFGFVGYGTNTIRAGLAFATFLLAITYRRNLIIMLALFLIASGIHFSVVIPVIMFIIARYFPHTKIFFFIWFMSVPISFFAGDLFNDFFAQFSEDQRTHYLTNNEHTHYKVGFRIDFIVYSLLPVVIGYYYIFVRKFKSVWYKNVYNTYLLTNIFWILVITSNFSDRFAYLSWFLIPIILVYPILINSRIVRQPNYWLAGILTEEVLFKLLI